MQYKNNSNTLNQINTFPLDKGYSQKRIILDSLKVVQNFLDTLWWVKQLHSKLKI